VSIRETPKIQQLCLPLDIGWTWRRTAASIHGQGRRAWLGLEACRRAWLGLEACGREGGCERRRATPEIQRFRLPLDIGWMRRRVTAPIHEQGRRLGGMRPRRRRTAAIGEVANDGGPVTELISNGERPGRERGCWW
jgi:hypothetical protein